MSKVTKEFIYVDKVGIEIEINYRVKTSQFFIALGADAEAVLGYTEVTDAELAGLRKKFTDAKRIVFAAKTQKTKVIGYDLEIKSLDPNQTGRTNFSWGDGSRHLGIELWAGVFTETSTVSGNTHRYTYTLEKSTIPLTFGVDNNMRGTNHERSRFVVPWTQQTEDFFANLATSMTDIIDRIDASGIAKDGSALVKVLAQGMNPLLLEIRREK